MDSPCFNCDKRYFNCHSLCDKYKEYKILNNKVKNRINKIKKYENEYVSFQDNSYNNTKKKVKK